MYSITKKNFFNGNRVQISIDLEKSFGDYSCKSFLSAIRGKHAGYPEDTGGLSSAQKRGIQKKEVMTAVGVVTSFWLVRYLQF
jgi:hypothetical protein